VRKLSLLPWCGLYVRKTGNGDGFFDEWMTKHDPSAPKLIIYKKSWDSVTPSLPMTAADASKERNFKQEQFYEAIKKRSSRFVSGSV
jgi:hypothetical protein